MAVPFCLSAEPPRRNRSRGASLASLLTAGLLQTVAGALLIVLPLLGTPALPEPHRPPPRFILSVKPAPPPASRESAPRSEANKSDWASRVAFPSVLAMRSCLAYHRQDKSPPSR